MGPLAAALLAIPFEGLPAPYDGTCALQTRSNFWKEPPLWSFVDLLPRQAASSFVDGGKANPNKSVNVFIGTGGHGHTFPGATTPWGMVQATPWTHSASVSGWDTQSGYTSAAPDLDFYGMAHSALSGAGTGEMGELRLLPLIPDQQPSMVLLPQTADASPGFFAVKVAPKGVADSGPSVGIRSTATPRGAVHEFAFTGEGGRSIAVNLTQAPNSFWGWVLQAHRAEVVSDRRFEGCMLGNVTGIGNALAHMCFVVEFDEAFESPAPALQPSEAAVAFTFPAGSRPLTARVAISRTDLAHAQTAFDMEVAGRSFDDVLKDARSKWDKALGSLRVTIKSPARNRIFYTALYHSMISPNLLSDADGSYRLQKAAAGELPMTAVPVDFDRLEEKLPLRMAKDGGSIFHTFSAWDTYRSLHPLMNLVQPQVSQGFGESLMAFSDAWGYIPPWQLVQSPTDMMEGDGGSIILATMAVEGLVDKQRALEALAKGRMQPVNDKRKCVGSPECLEDHISELLEQAKSDRCVARVAERVGDSRLAALFTNRSNSAFALWDKQQGVFAPFDATGPDGGHFMHVGRGMEHASNAYMEGSALQYSWSAEFDIPKMIELRGGEEGFVCALDQTIYHSKAQTGDIDMTGSFGAISLGNEPTMHVPYLYSLAGYPSRTQELVGRLMDELFTDKTDGLPGNDDLGQMSSWIIFTMLGFYPVDPCSGEYALGRPLVEEAELTLRDSVKLSIKVNNQSDTNVYVSHLQWNSRDLDVLRPKLTFDMISGGGLLEFWMASKPVSDQRVKCELKASFQQNLSQKAPSRRQRRARRSSGTP